jgi:hypothetical protein
MLTTAATLALMRFVGSSTSMPNHRINRCRRHTKTHATTHSTAATTSHGMQQQLKTSQSKAAHSPALRQSR